jgi:hypothetical protein
MSLDQLLNWHGALAALSAVLAVASAVVYIKDVLKGGETKPNAVSFFLWTVLQGVAVIAQWKAGASWSVVFMIVMTIDTAIVAFIALIPKWGYRKYGWREIVCFVCAIAAAAALWHDPVDAILLAIVGDLFAFYPTVVKTQKEPQSEHLTAWVLVTAASLAGVLSTGVWDVANLAFPVYQVVMNGLIVFIAYSGRGGKGASP